MEMSRLARDETAESVSRDQIIRRERGEGNNYISKVLLLYMALLLYNIFCCIRGYRYLKVLGTCSATIVQYFGATPTGTFTK